MNKKLWFPGGEPNINADDLIRDSEANNRAFQNTLKAWLTGYNENFIISGCVPTITPGVNCSVTDGYIFLNGEILRVDAQTLAAGTTDFYMYEKQTTYDPNGTKTFIDLTVRETWQVNRAVLVNVLLKPVPATNLDVEGATWCQKVKNKIKGEFRLFTPNDYDLTEAFDLNYLRFDLSGSAGTFRVDVPNADDPTNQVDVNFFYFFESDPNLPRCTYDFFDKNGTQLAHVTYPQFSIIMNSGGVWVEAAFVPLDQTNGDPPLQEIVVPSWNMDADNMITIPHSLLSKDNLKEVTARIYNDAGDTLYNYASDGQISWNDSDIILNHTPTSIFDGADFNGTGFDRGKIYIQT